MRCTVSLQEYDEYISRSMNPNFSYQTNIEPSNMPANATVVNPFIVVIFSY